jgi:hypothetical protein
MPTKESTLGSPSSQATSNAKSEMPIPTQSPIKMILKYWHFYVILFLLLAVAGMYIGKNMAVSKTRAELTQRAAQVIGEQNRSLLRLASIPFVWAVRSEMLRGNLDQVNQYLTLFVKEPGMKEIIVAGPDGVGLVATNKKREGATVTGSFPPEVLKSNVTMLSTLVNGDLVVAAPVMGLNSRLGTLILVSSPAQYSLEVPTK